jgi:vWA-MoxR associated protein C-terminal domain/vWA-MoxR associated protein middle region 0/Effector-associated domain 2
LDHPGSSSHDLVRIKRLAIAEAFRGVDLLRDPEGLRMCVELSEEEIGESIPRAKANNADAHGDAILLELVDQLLSRDVALWVFVYTIADIYGPGEIADSVLAAVRSYLAEPVLGREQRAALHRMCRDIVGLDVPRLFSTSVDRMGYALRSDPGNLCAVLNELEEFQARDRDGLHPIAVFVEYLAGGQPSESADRLRAWLGDFVGTRTPHVNALRSIRADCLVPDDPELPHCLIYLNADDIDTSLCYVSIYFQEGLHPIEPLRPPDDVACTEVQVRARIGEALNSPKLSGIHPADMRIEFLLPTFLVNLPVDRWRVGAAEIPLGVQYQVVVRSLTRLQEVTSAHAYLRGKWSKTGATQFCVPPTAIATGFQRAGGVCWLTEEAADHDRDQLFVILAGASGPVCVLLAGAPVPDRCRALTLALVTGIPVLMWSRRPEADLRSGLTGLLADNTPLWLRDLPLRALQFRIDAAARHAGENNLANHLTLLYDDADRIPDAGYLF